MDELRFVFNLPAMSSANYLGVFLTGVAPLPDGCDSTELCLRELLALQWAIWTAQGLLTPLATHHTGLYGLTGSLCLRGC